MKKIPMYKRDLPDFDLAEMQRRKRKIFIWSFSIVAFIVINLILYFFVSY